jgi:1-acyl-sn-glycerol-3-phosphate acyltransferase
LWAMPRLYTAKVAAFWASGFLKILGFCLGIHHKITGWENLPKHGTYIIACKHQSMWETLIFPVILKDPAVILKQELLGIPVFGWFLKNMEMIPVQREKSLGIKAIKGSITWMKEAKKAIQKGRSLVIFPEGTRLDPGAQGIYHPGIFHLAHHFSLETIPVALNSGVFWKRHGFIKYPGLIHMRFCPGIPPMDDKKAYMELLKNTIDEACRTL